MAYLKLLTIVFGFFCVNILNAQIYTNMFLGRPTHIPVKNNIANDCFNKMSWRFNAGAAVRTTPVADNKNIYFGTEKGDFFCVDQSSGKTVWKFTSSYPIHTSAALKNGNVFFSDSKQTLYALSTSS